MIKRIAALSISLTFLMTLTIIGVNSASWGHIKAILWAILVVVGVGALAWSIAILIDWFLDNNDERTEVEKQMEEIK